MKVLIAKHISFEENCNSEPFAMIFGDYKIVDMTEEEFNDWSEWTNEDWITSEYRGDVYISKAIKKQELFV